MKNKGVNLNRAKDGGTKKEPINLADRLKAVKSLMQDYRSSNSMTPPLFMEAASR